MSPKPTTAGRRIVSPLALGDCTNEARMRAWESARWFLHAVPQTQGQTVAGAAHGSHAGAQAATGRGTLHRKDMCPRMEGIRNVVGNAAGDTIIHREVGVNPLNLVPEVSVCDSQQETCASLAARLPFGTGIARLWAQIFVWMPEPGGFRATD